jgi:hypothetical protein
MTIQGTYGNDILNGTTGNDTLDGKDGNDIIFGNDGNDFLSGDRGVDTLTGGPGKDTFSFEVNSSGGMKAANGIFITNKPDIVTDFAQAGIKLKLRWPTFGKVRLVRAAFAELCRKSTLPEKKRMGTENGMKKNDRHSRSKYPSNHGEIGSI